MNMLSLCPENGLLAARFGYFHDTCLHQRPNKLSCDLQVTCFCLPFATFIGQGSPEKQND